MLARLLITLLYGSSAIWVQDAPPQSQPAAKHPEFEVATIKPSAPLKSGDFAGIRPLPGGQTYIAKNVPVRLIIRLMYHLTDRQVSGGPAWINTDVWDIEAKAEHPSTIDELHVMFQNLLVDRFHLQFHYENKEMSAYALVVDKSGSKMKVNDSPEPFEIPIQGAGRGVLKGTHVSMSYLTWFLAGAPMIDRPIVDKTGLPGFYDFTFELAPPPPPASIGGDSGPAPQGPDLFTALREQLGLKLEPQKTPVQVMVIDHIEKPSEN